MSPHIMLWIITNTHTAAVHFSQHGALAAPDGIPPRRQDEAQRDCRVQPGNLGRAHNRSTSQTFFHSEDILYTPQRMLSVRRKPRPPFLRPTMRRRLTLEKESTPPLAPQVCEAASFRTACGNVHSEGFLLLGLRSPCSCSFGGTSLDREKRNVEQSLWGVDGWGVIDILEPSGYRKKTLRHQYRRRGSDSRVWDIFSGESLTVLFLGLPGPKRCTR